MTTYFNRIDPTPPVRSSWLVPAALTCAAAAVVGLSGFVFSSEALSISALPVALKDTVVTPLLALDLQQAVPAICTAAGAYLHSLWTTPAPLEGMNHDFQKTEPNPRKREHQTALAAVQKNWRAIQDIPKELITDEIAIAAVRQNGLTIQYIPYKLLTEKIAIAAVQENWKAIQYIPYELLTEKITLAAVQQNWEAISTIPEALRTEKFALPAVQQNWEAIRSIPEELLTEKIALAAVQQNWEAILSVPTALLTDHVIDSAFGEHSDIPSFVQQQCSAQQLKHRQIIGNLQSITPTTGPLPAALQSFVDQHLFTDKELTSHHLVSQGFEHISEGSLKDVWIHPSLPGYVLKINHDREFSKDHSSYALIQDALTMRHLQTLVDEHNLSHVHIPETYLIINENQGAVIQERVELVQSYRETEGWSELETLIQLMDQKFYPLISDAVKKRQPSQIRRIVTKLVERAHQRPLSPEFQQLIERAWVWDLAPIFAHNAGSTKEFPEDIFILDGGL